MAKRLRFLKFDKMEGLSFGKAGRQILALRERQCMLLADALHPFLSDAPDEHWIKTLKPHRDLVTLPLDLTFQKDGADWIVRLVGPGNIWVARERQVIILEAARATFEGLLVFETDTDEFFAPNVFGWRTTRCSKRVCTHQPFLEMCDFLLRFFKLNWPLVMEKLAK